MSKAVLKQPRNLPHSNCIRKDSFEWVLQGIIFRKFPVDRVREAAGRKKSVSSRNFEGLGLVFTDRETVNRSTFYLFPRNNDLIDVKETYLAGIIMKKIETRCLGPFK